MGFGSGGRMEGVRLAVVFITCTGARMLTHTHTHIHMGGGKGWHEILTSPPATPVGSNKLKDVMANLTFTSVNLQHRTAVKAPQEERGQN